MILKATHSGLMKNVTYLEMDQAINKPYITYKEVMILGMCGENRARQIMKEINDDCEKKGFLTYRQKPMLVCTDLVLEKLNLNAKKIHTEAERIRKSG